MVAVCGYRAVQSGASCDPLCGSVSPEAVMETMTHLLVTKLLWWCCTRITALASNRFSVFEVNHDKYRQDRTFRRRLG